MNGWLLVGVVLPLGIMLSKVCVAVVVATVVVAVAVAGWQWQWQWLGDSGWVAG
jgi:hypothetical protein